jgi:hypothetical protein
LGFAFAASARPHNRMSTIVVISVFVLFFIIILLFIKLIQQYTNLPSLRLSRDGVTMMIFE